MAMDLQRFFTRDYTFEMILFCIAENVLLLLLTILIGRCLEGSWVRFDLKEKRIALAVLIVNCLVTVCGFYLYLFGFIRFNVNRSLIEIILDTVFILVGMDFLMFVFHYVAHRWQWLYRFHHLHHEHVDTRMEDLFQLHPIEALGFGSIWLGFIVVFHFSFIAVVVYLVINFVWGLAGHYSREMISSRYWISKILTNSAFHHRHHHDEEHNYGFYFTFWDKLYQRFIVKRIGK